ncbi:hypothetical protein PR202_ga25219 [Eleusine coracana subsp. coracana]|uniref:FAR1 domain-containing protein n=1 Tax=Eleusine coracana subsp. coracana TaxID=191504 RepID=A0AAV5DAQ4_ELECO|nr:hypothetical protein PR202_ga25219 [Eleusine coracana subsp. coracana]
MSMMLGKESAALGGRRTARSATASKRERLGLHFTAHAERGGGAEASREREEQKMEELSSEERTSARSRGGRRPSPSLLPWRWRRKLSHTHTQLPTPADTTADPSTPFFLLLPVPLHFPSNPGANPNVRRPGLLSPLRRVLAVFPHLLRILIALLLRRPPTPAAISLAQAASASAAGDEADVDDAPTSPCVGMYFETEDDAYEFYKAYAARLGFVVRKSNKSKNSRHTVTRRLFVCSKQGFRQEPKKAQDEAGAGTSSSPAPPRCPDSRTGCLASLTIKLVPSVNAFRVTDFVVEHNHPLASAAPAVQVTLPIPSLRMLKQASNAYTPEAFKVFQGYPGMGNHVVASSSQAISFGGNQHPEHTTEARGVAQTTNGIVF